MNDVVTLGEAVEQGRKWGAKAPLAPLILAYETCETDANLERNIRATLATDYRPFNELLCPPHERTVSICGFGPSLSDTWEQIDGDVWACNGAHNWLIDKGVIPKYGMFWDASSDIAKFIQPHRDVTYLVASRCHRDVFAALEGCNVYVWHAQGDSMLDELLCEFKRAEPMLPGGSAAVTRAMLVVTTMGYRKMKFFGADGSFSGEYTHAQKSIVDEQPIEVWCDGRQFHSTSWLAGQVEDFKKLALPMRDQGCSIELYGDGLLQHVARINGFVVHDNKRN